MRGGARLPDARVCATPLSGMRSLLAATLLWALSFGLIKGHLGGLDHERSATEARVQLLCEQTLLGCARLDVVAALAGRGGVGLSDA